MSEDQPTPGGTGCLVSSAHWIAFLLAYPFSIVVISIGMIGWVMASGTPADQVETALTDPAVLGGPGFLGASAVFQIGMLAAIAALLALFLPRRPGQAMAFEPSLDKLAFSHAFRRTHLGWFAVAATATLTLGLLPGWFAEQLMSMDALSALAEQMAQIGEALEDPSAPGWPLLAFAVGVTAPFCEELIFRGYLWRAAESSLPGWGVWLLTSVVFAAYHMNPIHVLSVLPIGLFLGWLRWQSGSVWPSMLAHFVNNSLAIGLTVVGVDEDFGLLLCAAAFAVSLGIVAAGWYAIPRPAPEAR